VAGRENAFRLYRPTREQCQLRAVVEGELDVVIRRNPHALHRSADQAAKRVARTFVRIAETLRPRRNHCLAFRLDGDSPEFEFDGLRAESDRGELAPDDMRVGSGLNGNEAQSRAVRHDAGRCRPSGGDAWFWTARLRGHLIR